MFERQISRSMVHTVLETGRAIAEYPDDKPFPSSLLLGFIDDRPLHVVTAYDEEVDTCYVISVYEPDTELWESDFATRKPQ